MYFPTVAIILAGLSSLTVAAASPYDDGMWHPDVTTTASYVPPGTTSYISPTMTRSTYIGYWSSNSTATTTALTKPMTTASYNTSHTMTDHAVSNMTRSVNGSMTMTSTRIYTTTVCDFESSCYVSVVTATGGTRVTDMPQPTMTPFSSSSRLAASGWGALVLCGVALLL